MSNLRDLELNITNRTFSKKRNEQRRTHEDSHADVQELIGLLTLRRVRLREWIHWAIFCYSNRKYDSFVTLLETAITHGNKSYSEYKEELLRTYTLLTAHYVSQVCCEPGQCRSIWLEKVKHLMEVMDNMHTECNEIQHLLVRGFALLVLETRLQEADNYFIAVLHQVPHNVLALVGRACLAYNREEYRVALGYFKDVLLHHPHGPADVRVGIGHCFLQLDDMDSARRAFELALLYNGRCLNALLGMAQLKFNERQLPSNQEAVNLLSAAFDLNGQHPLVLSWLAGYFYYTRNYEQVQVAAGNAYLFTDNVRLKAQNCYQIARSFHGMHKYESAYTFYAKADNLCDEDYAPPHLGLAQMYIRRGQLECAERSLCKLLQLMPHQPQAWRMLATLYAQEDSATKLDTAKQLFEKVLHTNAEDDYDLWLGLASVYERKQHWQQALHSYGHAVEIFQRSSKGSCRIPLAWLNNMAIIQLYAKLPQAALQTLDNALSMSFDGDEESNRRTLRFNRARVLEQLGCIDKAEYSYKQLILEYPNYYDSYLRLSAMCYNRMEASKAIEYLRAVLDLDGDNVAARTYLGHIHMQQGELTKAIYHYNKIMCGSANLEDFSIRIAVGNLYLIEVERAQAVGDQETAKEHQEYALQMFKKSLKWQERRECDNGMLLCNYGQLDDTKMMFKKILESSKQGRETLLNLAHMTLELGRYAEAIELYTQCLREIPFGNCAQAMQLLARSLCQGGRIKEAKDWLLKARHVAPQDMKLLYNLAVIIKQESSDTFGLKGECIQLAALRRAEGQLKLAESFFKHLEEHDASLDLASEQVTHCSRLLRDLTDGIRENGLDNVENKPMGDQESCLVEQEPVGISTTNW